MASRQGDLQPIAFDFDPPRQKATARIVDRYGPPQGRAELHASEVEEAPVQPADGWRESIDTLVHGCHRAKRNLHRDAGQPAKGGIAHISTYDVYQSNGVIHVIDKVLMP